MMMSVKTSLLLLLLCALSSGALSQELKLAKGSKQKTFKQGTVLDVFVVPGELSAEKCDCDYARVIGTLASVGEDSIRFNVQSINSSVMLGDARLERAFRLPDAAALGTFARKDLVEVKKYKKNNVLQVVGSILLIGGGATVLGAFAAPDRQSRFNIRALGAAQIGLGLILGTAGNIKTYRLKQTEGDVWVIR